MTKAVMTTDFRDGVRVGPQYAMNPQSVVYPEMPREDGVTVTSQGADRRRRDYDGPVTVLNKDWKPTK